jgi:hypothetical protein
LSEQTKRLSLQWLIIRENLATGVNEFAPNDSLHLIAFERSEKAIRWSVLCTPGMGMN